MAPVGWRLLKHHVVGSSAGSTGPQFFSSDGSLGTTDTLILQFQFFNLRPSVDGDELWVRWAGNGSTAAIGASIYDRSVWPYGNNNWGQLRTSAGSLGAFSGYTNSSDMSGNSSFEGFDGWANCHNPQGTANPKRFYGESVYTNPTPEERASQFACMIPSTLGALSIVDFNISEYINGEIYIYELTLEEAVAAQTAGHGLLLSQQRNRLVIR